MNAWEQSFGKIAYEAFDEFWKKDPLRPGQMDSFLNLPEATKKAWTAAAHAAIAAYRADVEQSQKSASAS